MRTLKIVVITLLLLILAALALFALRGLMPTEISPSSDTDHDDVVQPSDDIYSRQLKEYEGVVKPLGVSIYGEGTHRLERDDQLVALLQSSRVNLPDFESQTVQVRGLVRDTVEGGQKIMDVQWIEILSDSGTRSFSEVGYEFSFSYPSQWQVKKENDKVTFFLEDSAGVENLMAVYQSEDVKVPLTTWLRDRDQNLVYEESAVKVGALDGLKRVITTGQEEIVKTYVQQGAFVYELRLLSSKETVKNQYSAIVDFFQPRFLAPEEEPVTPPEETPPNEDETGSETPPEETPPPVGTSGKVFHELSPLTTEELTRTQEKGYAAFSGRTLSFDAPRVWWFSYLPDEKAYGLTDDPTYKANARTVTLSISRILILQGKTELECSYRKSRTLNEVEVTVCAREPGLEAIVDHIAASLL